MASKLMLFNLSRLAGRYPVQVGRSLSCSVVRGNKDKAPERGPPIDEKKASNNPPATGNGGFLSFMKDRTGATGTGTLLFGVSAFLISKEYYVLDGETLVGVVLGGLAYYAITRFSKPVMETLDAETKEHVDFFEEKKDREVTTLNQTIEDEMSVEQQAVDLKQIFEINRDINAMKLETEYRRRQDEVRGAVLKRLNYRVDVDATQRRHEHRHLLQWIEESVKDSVKGKQDESFNQCMETLKRMSAA